MKSYSKNLMKPINVLIILEENMLITYNITQDKIEKYGIGSSDANTMGATLNYWKCLDPYSNGVRLYIDNNHTERQIRQCVMSRNNFLPADSVKGAQALCLHLSIIQTAIQNKLEPYDYYVDIRKRLLFCQTIEVYEALLPWYIRSLKALKVLL
jgi:hypothetical protein